jgi:hypothetical protein
VRWKRGEVHYEGAGENSPATAEAICDERENGHCDHRADRVDCVEETEGGAFGVVEVVFPIRNRLLLDRTLAALPEDCS